MAEANLIEKQAIVRARRGEQKEVQHTLVQDRVKKFATLIEKRDSKYTNLAQLARVILVLLGQEVPPEVMEVNVESFKNLPELLLKMNTMIPTEVRDNVLHEQETIIGDLREKYTKKGSPVFFKKVWKYDSLFNWACKFIEVIKANKAVQAIKAEIESYNKDLFDLEDEQTHVSYCMQDLHVFGYEKLKAEQEKMQNFIWRIEEDGANKVISRQQRILQFEENFFAPINEQKKKA